MKINIVSSGSSTKPLQRSGEFVLQNIDSLPKNIMVSGKLLQPSKAGSRSKLKENEFLFDKTKKIVIFRVPNIYEKLCVKVIDETSKS